jgi:hypothetical protein
MPGSRICSSGFTRLCRCSIWTVSSASEAFHSQAVGAAPKPIRGDHVVQPPSHAMTRIDALRNDAYTVAMASKNEPLPLSGHAHSRHRSLQDIDGLRELLAEYPGRLEALVRQPFEVEGGESAFATTMRMPPFMRNSNALPLTLSVWQYALLMEWAKSAAGGKRGNAKSPPRKMSPEATERRATVLARLDAQRPR